MLSDLPTLDAVSRFYAGTRGDKTALVFEGRSTTFAQFDRYATQVANGLAAAGVKPGGRVVHLGKNSDRYFELLFGAAKAGAVLVPVNWRLSPSEIEYIVNDSKAELLFVGREFGALAHRLRAVRSILSVDDDAQTWLCYEAWRNSQSTVDPLTKIGSDDIVLQLYTSGTTGRPKGAMLRHRGLTGKRYDPDTMADWQRWTSDDVGLIAMPTFHISGTGMGLLCLMHGAKGIVTREFDPSHVLDHIEKDRVSKIVLVPAAMQIIVRQPEAQKTNFSRIKHIIYGASPIPLTLLRECIEVFKCGFVQSYGMTELTGSITALPPEDHVPKGSERMRSAGKPLPGVDIAILDDAGRSLPQGEIGEIAARAPGIMAGYWGMPDATAEIINSDGWLRTGDAGYLDADGYLYVHDRMKDMIISGGENIYPAEIERIILGHPGVADVAVVGVPDDRWGEAVKAVIVAKEPGALSSHDIITYVQQKIAAFKVPKSVDFVDSLPRNASGKVLRRMLRERYWAGRDRFVN